jgi:hypothetical protein
VAIRQFESSSGSDGSGQVSLTFWKKLGRAGSGLVGLIYI